MLRISQIRLSREEPLSEIPKKIGQKLGIRNFEPEEWKIVKESVDAREKPDIRFVYTVDFKVREEAALLSRAKKRRGVLLEKAEEIRYEVPFSAAGSEKRTGEDKPKIRPVIAGFGPCGMFAALILAEAGLRPVVVERGRDADRRAQDVEHFWNTGQLDPVSNVQFGEGGAGTFSDGKLTTGIRDKRTAKVKEELIEAGADPAIAYRHMPHVGTDVLRTVVKNIRRKIISLGGEVRFETQVTGLQTETGADIQERNMPEGGKKLTGLQISSPEGMKTIPCSDVVLAVGNSARDTFRMLLESGVRMEAKPFSVGVRIEHPQSMIDLAQYGMEHNEEEGRLGAASYKLSARSSSGRGVYTFCMCPGGYVVGAASFEGGVVTNGMSYHDRSGENANSALLVDVRVSDYPGGGENPLAGIDLQEELERRAYEAGGGNYYAPVQRLGDFLNAGKAAGKDEKMQNGGASGSGKGQSEEAAKEEESRAHFSVEPTYRPGVRWTDVSLCLPDYVTEALREAVPEMAAKIRGFDMENAVLTGVETRSSSPVRILRGDSLESLSVSGLYPGGEGAGYAGGIMSAAVDGIRIAEEIIRKHSDGNEDVTEM